MMWQLTTTKKKHYFASVKTNLFAVHSIPNQESFTLSRRLYILKFCKSLWQVQLHAPACWLLFPLVFYCVWIWIRIPFHSLTLTQINQRVSLLRSRSSRQDCSGIHMMWRRLMYGYTGGLFLSGFDLRVDRDSSRKCIIWSDNFCLERTFFSNRLLNDRLTDNKSHYLKSLYYL